MGRHGAKNNANRIPLSLLPRRARLSGALLTALTPVACLLLLEGYTRGGIGKCLEWAVAQPLLFAANLLPLLGASLCLAFVARYRVRAALSAALALLCALYGVANHYKLAYRAEPILFTDVTQLGDAVQTVAGLDFKIDYTQLVWLGLGFAALLAACLLLYRGRQSSRPLLAPLAGVALLLVPMLYTFELAGGSRIDISDHASAEGSLYAAIALENNRRSLMRPDYDEADVRRRYAELAARAADVPEPSVKPNLVLVLAESFTDESFLGKYLNLTDTLMPFYSSLMDECEHGRIYVPKVGGGTSETEFEVLTGIRSRYSINPYSMGLPPINSLASILSAKGYRSTAIHWYAGVYYNRYHNLKMEGFSSFHTTDTTDREFEKTGMFVSDAEHYRSVLDTLKASESRDFIFCLTMQNHGGYGYDDFRKSRGADVPFTNELSDESEMLAANYCYLLRRSDEALEELVAGLRELDEPTVLIYFGDHLPPLGAKAYEELGMPTTGAEGHMTPYFIWSNYETLSGGSDMRAYELGAHALAVAGLCDDPYLREVERLRAEGAEEDDTIDLLSYDALFGKQYAYSEGGLSPACDTFEIGGKMELAGFDAAELGGAIYLRAWLAKSDQTYTLYVNGQPREPRLVTQSDGALRLQCVMRNSNGRVFNQSETLEYPSAEALLQASGKLPYKTRSLADCVFRLAEGGISGGRALIISEKPLGAGRTTALTINGERLSWQPAYAVRSAGQYGVDDSGRVIIALSLSELGLDRGESGEGAVPEAARRYFEAGSATLYAFED